MKLHQKAYLLVELSKSDALWDSEIVARALREYEQAGAYWEKAIRVALEELAAGGLIARKQSIVTRNQERASISFQYAMTDFGRKRMIDTGLTSEATG